MASLKQPRGRKRLRFEDLSESVKDKRSRMFAKEPLEKLLRSAEKAAHHQSSPAIAKVLQHLRKGGELWDSETMHVLIKAEKISEPSVEDSLLLKTRYSLSKNKYQGVERFMKQQYGVKVLKPWHDIMEHRNNILPKISAPNWDNDYLSVHVKLRDMAYTDVMRMMELSVVNSKVSSLITQGEQLDCVLHISAGVDSATGFSHYNQDKIIGRDDSLLSEHMMCLKLEAKQTELWTNPNPQSDVFCKARSMNWVKEKDVITKNMFEQFFEEVKDTQDHPIKVHTAAGTLNVSVSAIYSLIDGKAANAIVGNKNTHACPMCVSGADPRVGPSFFHSRLNTVEWLIRVSAQKAVDGHQAQANPEVRLKAREIADQLEVHFKMNINRPKIGGSGSSNNGNMARRLLEDPENFAKILGISKDLVQNIRLLSCLALSAHKLVAEKVEELYNSTESLIRQEFDFVRKLPPCFHKYSHLPELIRTLPYELSKVDEQAGEKCHRRYKHARVNLARKTSPEDNIIDLIRVSLTWSDIKMSTLEWSAKEEKKHHSKDGEFVQLMTSFYADNTDHEISLYELGDCDETESDSSDESGSEDSDDNESDGF